MPDDEILDAIREGRFAAVKRELASKLKRFPNKSYYWALHCYYLWATGDLQSAEKESNTLKLKTPSDPAALEILSEVYVKLGKPQVSLEIWSNAVKKYPSTDLILKWFNRGLQAFDTRNMQKASMILQKHAKSKREYGVWAALCNFLLSRELTEEKEQTLHLALALELIEKAQPLQSNEEIFVLVSVLSAKHDFDKIKEIIRPLEYRELELTLIYLDALDKVENWELLASESRKLLFESKFDDFNTWRYLIRASKNLGVPYSEILNLIEFGTRNSYVANIELSKVYEFELPQAIEKYYAKFSSKPCCPIDLSNYEIPDEFHEKIFSESEELLKSEKLDGKQAILLTNIEKLKNLKNPSHMIDWSKFLKFTTPELSDLYLIHILKDLKLKWSPQLIVRHIPQLEHFSKIDPENFRVKMWLLNLYGAIGATSLSLKLYKDLKIKMIQHDLYLYKLHLTPSIGNLNEFVQIYRFYLTSDDEVSACIDGVFEKELYSKAEDFLKFGNRLANSISRHTVILQILRMSRILHNDYHNYFFRLTKEIKDTILSKDFKLVDNREFKTEYKFGLELPNLPFQDSDRAKGTEYVQLQYLKELIIPEKDDAEIKKLMRLFNRWMGTPTYTKQLSPSEHHIFKLYLSLFKAAKIAGTDRDLEINYLKKNLDFAKVKLSFLDKTSPLNTEYTEILNNLWEIAGVIRIILRDSVLVAIALKLERDLQIYTPVSEQLSALKSIRESLEFPEHLNPSISETFEDLAQGIKNSAYRPREH